MDGHYWAGLSGGLNNGMNNLASANSAYENAKAKGSLLGAQTAKYGNEAAETARQAGLRQNPEFLQALATIYGQGAAQSYAAGGNADKFSDNAMGTQKYQFRERVLNNIGDPGTDQTKINMGTSALEGKTYEPYAAMGDTGYVFNKGNGAVNVGDPGMANMFRQGQQAQNDLRAAQAMKAANPGATSYNNAYDETLAKSQVEQDAKIRNAGMQAASGLGKLDQMEKLVGDYEGGLLTGPGMAVASLGQSLGIPIDKNLGAKQAADALFKEFTLKLKNAGGENSMPGAMSDSDRNFLASMSPQLDQSAAGRRQIIQSYRAVLQRDQQIAMMAQKYKERNNGRLDDGFYSRLAQWSTQNPIFGRAQ